MIPHNAPTSIPMTAERMKRFGIVGNVGLSNSKEGWEGAGWGLSRLDALQHAVGTNTAERWPRDTMAQRVNLLFEEGGELARCVKKRDEGTRGTYLTWTAELRGEIGQVGTVLLDMAHREGFSLLDAVLDSYEIGAARSVDHDPHESADVLALRQAAEILRGRNAYGGAGICEDVADHLAAGGS